MIESIIIICIGLANRSKHTHRRFFFINLQWEFFGECKLIVFFLSCSIFFSLFWYRWSSIQNTCDARSKISLLVTVWYRKCMLNASRMNKRVSVCACTKAHQMLQIYPIRPYNIIILLLFFFICNLRCCSQSLLRLYYNIFCWTIYFRYEFTSFFSFFVVVLFWFCLHSIHR